MQRVDDGLAQDGEVIWARHQFAGRGQRNNHWTDSADNLKMSLIVRPEIQSDKQFELNALIALTLVRYLQQLNNDWQVAIKWPNDIYINDKKACGVLVDNIFRGMQWMHAIIGIGLNVNQAEFPEQLSRATSLHKESGRFFELQEIIMDLRSGLLNRLRSYQHTEVDALMTAYNNNLYLRHKHLSFRLRKENRLIEGVLQEVNPAGNLVLLTYKGIEEYAFGSLEWML